jgi:hypothetical protein
MIFLKNRIHFTIKATVIVIIALFPFIHSAVFAQAYADSVMQKRVTLGRLKATTYEALNRITDSTGYLFVYDSRIISNEKKVRLNIQPSTIKEALDQILADTTLCYKTIGKHIILYRTAGSPKAEKVIQQADSSKHIILKGRIVDSQNQRALAFATIGIPKLAIGNVSNSEGFFSLKLPFEALGLSVTISHLGYKTRTVPVEVLLFEASDIFLDVEYVSIQEVIIRQFDPRKMVEDFITRIPQNYGKEPTYLTAFYREGVRKGNGYLNYSEGIFKIYKSSYASGYETDQVKTLKTRKLRNVNPSDTLDIKLKGGIGGALMLDIAKNIDNFFSKEVLELYNFTKSDIVVFNERLTYAINFDQKEFVTDPLIEGTLYIDIETLSLVGADMQVNPQRISGLTNQLVVKRNRRISIKPEKVTYSIRYGFLNHKFHLSHVRGDLQFKYKRRNQLFYGRFYAFLEMATSHVDSLNVTRFERKDAEPLTSIFSETASKTDDRFWKNFNSIPPEANLYEALKNMSFEAFTSENE